MFLLIQNNKLDEKCTKRTIVKLVAHLTLTIHRFYHDRMDSSNKVKDLNDTVVAEPSDEDATGSDFRKAVAYVYLGKDYRKSSIT